MKQNLAEQGPRPSFGYGNKNLARIAVAALLVLGSAKVVDAAGGIFGDRADVEFTSGEHLGGLFPTLADAQALTEAQKKDLIAKYGPNSPDMRDFTDVLGLAISYNPSDVSVPARSALSILTYEAQTFEGANVVTYGGYVGHISVMEINGELVAVGINHVVEDAPLAKSYYVDIPEVGHIPLGNVNNFNDADVIPGYPSHIQSGRKRSDPASVVPIPYESQLYLRMMQSAGFFEPIQLAEVNLKEGNMVYVVSQLSGRLVPLKISGVVDENTLLNGDPSLNIGGQYRAEVEGPVYSDDVFVTEDSMICTGFSGAPVYVLNEQNKFAAVGLLSTAKITYKDDPNRDCGVKVTIEPL